MEHYDLVVIGSGPAGEKGAARAAYFGKRVALSEHAPHVGGAGVNTGTIPSKTLRETALYFSGLQQRGLYGVDYFAAGRLGNTRGLGLERIGIPVGDRGHLTVNERYQTAIPHIYAAGDVIGFPALAATSMEQARVAMCHAFDLKYKTRVAPVFPLAVYTIPEVAMAGETEETCREKGIDHCVGRALYRANARGQITGDLAGQIKLVFRASDKALLGVHIIGAAASELIHVGLMVMQAGGTIDAFIETVFNYPTLGEAYKYATYDGLGALARRQEKR